MNSPTDETADKTVNLCDTCLSHPAECGVIPEKIGVEDIPGSDNVWKCSGYHIKGKPEEVPQRGFFDLNLLDLFTYKPPFGDQPQRYKKIRSSAKEFAQIILNNCPDSADKTIAIRKIQEAVMWANASIAINEKEK